MKKISQKSTIEEVAAIVSEALNENGILAVLTGGAVVTLYSENQYPSWDLDFVMEGIFKKVDPIMIQLGFRKDRGRHFVHPKSKIFVEFPAGPLAIGDERVKDIAEYKSRYGVIRMLPPTECVMDRLAAYYHWDDYQALEQAVAVASLHPIKLGKIKAWSARERMSEKYQLFVNELKKVKKRE